MTNCCCWSWPNGPSRPVEFRVEVSCIKCCCCWFLAGRQLAPKRPLERHHLATVKFIAIYTLQKKWSFHNKCALGMAGSISSSNWAWWLEEALQWDVLWDAKAREDDSYFNNGDNWGQSWRAVCVCCGIPVGWSRKCTYHWNGNLEQVSELVWGMIGEVK